MPRPILFNSGKQNNQEIKQLAEEYERQKKITSVDAPIVLDELKKPRSPKIISLIKRLDEDDTRLNHQLVKELKDELYKEFPAVDLPGILKGIVGKCYLGDDFDVHTLTDFFTIVHHYKFGEKMPVELEPARKLAEMPEYAYIEVYSDSLRAVDEQGNVSEISLK